MGSITTASLPVLPDLPLPNDSMTQVFHMPLHYPRYTRSDYQTMPESKLDYLLTEYGLHVSGDVEAKRRFAMGAFLWPANCPEGEQKTPSYGLLLAYILSFFAW